MSEQAQLLDERKTFPLENPWDRSGCRPKPLSPQHGRLRLIVQSDVTATVNAAFGAGDVVYNIYFTQEQGASARIRGPRTADVVDFLDSLYSLRHSGEIRLAAERIVNVIDDLLNEGDFNTCVEALDLADVERLSPEMLIAFLGVTLAAKNKLKPARVGFLVRARDEMLKTIATERVMRLLDYYG
jgi:hypothetical protein